MHEDYEDKAPDSVWVGRSGRRRWPRRPVSARLLWRSGRQNGSPGAPLGTWAVDGTLALARPDGVRAYGLTTGEPLWSWQPPGDGDQVIAHVSRDMVEGVVVVLHHDDGRADDGRTNDGHARVGHVRLTGLDLRTGTAVWTREQRADELGSIGEDPPEVAPEVALGGGRIAVATARARDEGPETTVRVLDARTGAPHWERPLPEGRRDAFVLTAGPVVVSTAGPEDSVSTPTRLRLHMVREDSEQAIDLPQLYEAFGAHPVIVGDTLAVELVPPQPYDTEHMGSTLRAVSAVTGEFRWSWSSTYGRTIFPLAHRGALLVLNGYGDRATVLDPADGRVVAERSLPGYSYQARLVASGDCLAVVCTAPRTTARVRVFRWK
ncbi:outer membrane protein assembly factor BamB family protein [Streptomyces hokutonensis]|uniref:outer membrane protein assembly factor BamB family protein n=1 Tax=Streptomyces hokutonensis TaxID=1306990 RepID=UPI0003769024|nr:PQQ-binding-like beta-propeller repeat protein [Streptomyces hokutonensis]